MVNYWKGRIENIILIVSILASFHSCKSDQTYLFTSLPNTQTGIDFENKITDTEDQNILDFLYYYNGGGVAIADFNNDGLQDIFFTSNKESNKLYANKGELKFQDVTEKAGVQGKGNWKTGVTVADVNNDGLVDIYVSEVGAYKNLKGKNELYINKGNFVFEESAHAYGLDVEGFNAQSVFLDYDKDGDLDMFLVNFSVHSTETYVGIETRSKKSIVSGDKLFRNNRIHGTSFGSANVNPRENTSANKSENTSDSLNYFTEVTEEAGIISCIVGYGLNVVSGDFNNDGWDDIYVSNDFHENDYYYINQKNGTFKDENYTAFGHESRFSMGSDAADLNNDGLLDIVTMDMLSDDEKILKMSSGDEPLDVYEFKLSYGYHYQYSRNCLQINRGGGKQFSDMALYAGVSATDWSWSPLAADYDNDGIKDLFITNGILRRPNDLDFLNYISSTVIRDALQKNKQADISSIRQMPDGKMKNYFFKGSDSLIFKNVSNQWSGEEPSLSNGAAYADLDNDGDLDLVINNINSYATILRNNAKDSGNHYVDIELSNHTDKNMTIGARAILYSEGNMQVNYLTPTRGFLSASMPLIHFGLGKSSKIDSLKIIWANGKVQVEKNIQADQRLKIEYSDKSGDQNNFAGIHAVAENMERPFILESNLFGLNYTHEENLFNDFNLQPFLPHKLSTQGPKMAVADINGDALEDIFVCGAKGKASALYVQSVKGDFKLTEAVLFKEDSISEDVNALFFDCDQDGDKDLYVVTGGNETENDIIQKDRLYINDGKGHFNKSAELPDFRGNKSVAAASDIDRDGDLDIFVGGRVVASFYGMIPRSYLLINDGHGKFSLADSGNAAFIADLGMVTDAQWADIDNDGWKDLVVAGEWMPISIFKNINGVLKNVTKDHGLEQSSGWWNCVYVQDINGDGKEDIIAGNWGENSKLKASLQYPLKLYVNDLDNNGRSDLLLSFEKYGKYYPFLNREDLEKEMPNFIRKKYPSYESFASQTIEEILGGRKKNSILFEAKELASCIFLNEGNGQFKKYKLSPFLQNAPIFSLMVMDFDQDGRNDLFAGSNFYGVSPNEGRYDAGGLQYVSNFLKSSPGHMPYLAKGVSEFRDIKAVKRKNDLLVVTAVNNGNLMIVRKK